MAEAIQKKMKAELDKYTQMQKGEYSLLVLSRCVKLTAPRDIFNSVKPVTLACNSLVSCYT